MTGPDPDACAGRRSPAARPVGGRWFDEFAVGDVFHSPGRTVTEADIAAFAGLSGDYNPLHTDEEYARRTPFRGRIAHGLLVEAIASGLAHATGIFAGTIAALAEIRIRFAAPVRAGDTLRLALEVIEVDPEPGPRRGRIRFTTVVTNQSQESVVDGSWTVVFLRDRTRRHAAAAEHGEEPE